MNKITHSVVLSVLPDSPFGNLLQEMSNQIKLDNGKSLICLFCSELDTSRPNYLYVVAHKISNVADIDSSMGPGLETSIPHSLVLMIDHSHFVQKHIGFETSKTS